MTDNALYTEIDRLKAENERLHKEAEQYCQYGLKDNQTIVDLKVEVAKWQGMCEECNCIKIKERVIGELVEKNKALHKEANVNMKELCRVRGQLAKLRALIIEKARGK
jgi:hypothetical protein